MGVVMLCRPFHHIIGKCNTRAKKAKKIPQSENDTFAPTTQISCLSPNFATQKKMENKFAVILKKNLT